MIESDTPRKGMTFYCSFNFFLLIHVFTLKFFTTCTAGSMDQI